MVGGSGGGSLPAAESQALLDLTEELVRLEPHPQQGQPQHEVSSEDEGVLAEGIADAVALPPAQPSPAPKPAVKTAAKR